MMIGFYYDYIGGGAINNNTNSLLKYAGSKWKISDWIISHFPKHKTYLEPFFGSGACFFNKSPAYIETINDINGEIVNLFRVVRDNPDELARLILLTPYAREEFQLCKEKSDDPIEQARRTLVRFNQSFGTANANRNTWKCLIKSGAGRPETIWNFLPQAIQQCCKRLKNAQIEHTDALRLIERYNDTNTLIYCDPPYLRETRKKNIYPNEMENEEHEKLLDILLSSKSKIILSGYDNSLYNEKLSGWYTDTKSTTAYSGGKRIEKIWYNFGDNRFCCSLFDSE